MQFYFNVIVPEKNSNPTKKAADDMPELARMSPEAAAPRAICLFIYATMPLPHITNLLANRAPINQPVWLSYRRCVH